MKGLSRLVVQFVARVGSRSSQGFASRPGCGHPGAMKKVSPPEAQRRARQAAREAERAGAASGPPGQGGFADPQGPKAQSFGGGFMSARQRRSMASKRKRSG